MVHQPAGIGVREIGQCAQHLPMQLDPANGRQRVLDRTSEKLVPERDSVAGGYQHARRDADLHLLGRAEDQGRIGAGRYHRNQLGKVASGRRQGTDAVEDQILDRIRNRLTLGFEQFGDQQRVAAGELVDRFAVAARLTRLLAYAVLGQGLDRHPADDRVGQRRQYAAERVIRSHLVVAVGDEQQRRQPVDPAAQEGQPVQGRLVGPVRVLDHHQLRP